MASDQNRWFGTGHLGRDPEGTKADAGKKARATLSIAVNRNYVVDGETKESTTWVNCVAFDRIAEFCYQYLKKGQFVVVQGELQVRKYTGRDGTEKTVTEIVVREITAPGGARPRDDASNGNNRPEENYGGGYQPPSAPIGQTKIPDNPPDTRTPDQLFDNLGKPIITDDDIPF